MVAQLRAAAAAGPGGTGHAWLFTGPPGSGRSTAARAFAAAVLCGNGGCGHCPSCRQVAAGTHADLLLVQPDGLSYGVKQTGAWCSARPPRRSTAGSRSCCSKTPTGPPSRPRTRCSRPSRNPRRGRSGCSARRPRRTCRPTIRSRCRLVTLRIPPAQAVAEVLAAEGVAQDRALIAARAAQGHIGRARRLATDPDAAQRRDEVLACRRGSRHLGPALSAAAAPGQGGRGGGRRGHRGTRRARARARCARRSARARPARAWPTRSAARPGR